ncbi:MAG TPA: zinc ribbon domain-containing protein [Polyangiaceae bacterium]|jgi:hypothetical protein
MDRYKRREISDRKSFYLLSGLIHCAECGALMQIAGGAVPRYRCSANTKRGTCKNGLSVREGPLREGIISALAEKLSSPSTKALISKKVTEYLRVQAAEQNEKLTILKRERASIEARLAANEGKLRKLYLRWSEGDDRDETLESLISDLKTQCKRDRQAIAEAKAARAQ